MDRLFWQLYHAPTLNFVVDYANDLQKIRGGFVSALFRLQNYRRAKLEVKSTIRFVGRSYQKRNRLSSARICKCQMLITSCNVFT